MRMLPTATPHCDAASLYAGGRDRRRYAAARCGEVCHRADVSNPCPALPCAALPGWLDRRSGTLPTLMVATLRAPASCCKRACSTSVKMWTDAHSMACAHSRATALGDCILFTENCNQNSFKINSVTKIKM